MSNCSRRILDTAPTATRADDVRVIDETIAQKMRDKIDAAKKDGDSIGGVVQVI
jgi:chorismate synthase